MWPFKTNPNREKKMNYRSIDPNFAVAGQLLPAEMDQLAAAGFKSIVQDNVLVTVESIIGLLSFALAAGLVFARVSRPTAAIIFSRNADIAP